MFHKDCIKYPHAPTIFAPGEIRRGQSANLVLHGLIWLFASPFRTLDTKALTELGCSVDKLRPGIPAAASLPCPISIANRSTVKP